MRIGITCYSTYGGSGVLATELGKLLAKRGHEIHFITRDLPYRLQNTFHENIIFHPVEMLEYPLFGESAYPLALAAKMAEIVRRENLDLLHVHYAIPHATSAFLAQQMLLPRKLPIVTTLHGTDITLVGKNKGFSEITEFSINQSNGVSVVSDFLGEETEEFFDCKKELKVIPNFVDTELFSIDREGLCKKWMGENHGTVFVHISNFRPVKRTIDVVKAFALIHAKDPLAQLLMVGDGPDLSECRTLADELGVSKSIRFLGKQNDIVSVLKMSDVLLFPSEHESFGLVALEAMSCGIPVVASRAGGLPEVVDCGKTGFLCDVGDVKAFAEKALLLSQDCALREKMGKEARKVVLEKFTPEIVLPMYEDFYEETIQSMNESK